MKQVTERPPPTPKPGLPAKFEEAASKAYSELGVLRAGVALIPVVGSSLDAFLGARGQNIANRKMDRMLDELRRQVEAIGESKLDRDYLQSEEFFDLFRLTVEKALRTSHREKVALYVRVLRQSLDVSANRETAQEYLETLAEMSLTEVQVAAAIYRLQRDVEPVEPDGIHARKPVNNARAVAAMLTGMEAPLVETYLKRLERTGLVREAIGGMDGIGVVATQYRGGAFYMTDYFRSLMEYLEVTDLSEIWA